RLLAVPFLVTMDAVIVDGGTVLKPAVTDFGPFISRGCGLAAPVSAPLNPVNTNPELTLAKTPTVVPAAYQPPAPIVPPDTGVAVAVSRYSVTKLPVKALVTFGSGLSANARGFTLPASFQFWNVIRVSGVMLSGDVHWTVQVLQYPVYGVANAPVSPQPVPESVNDRPDGLDVSDTFDRRKTYARPADEFAPGTPTRTVSREMPTTDPRRSLVVCATEGSKRICCVHVLENCVNRYAAPALGLRPKDFRFAPITAESPFIATAPPN